MSFWRPAFALSIVRSAMRGIAGAGDIKVEMQAPGGILGGGSCRNARWVTVSILIIGSGAAAGEIRALRRLRKLPDIGKLDAAQFRRKTFS